MLVPSRGARVVQLALVQIDLAKACDFPRFLIRTLLAAVNVGDVMDRHSALLQPVHYTAYRPSYFV